MSDVFLSKSLIRSLFAHFLQITIDSLRKLMSKFPTLGFFVHFVFFFLIYFYCASFLFTLHPQVLFFSSSYYVSFIFFVFFSIHNYTGFALYSLYHLCLTFFFLSNNSPGIFFPQLSYFLYHSFFLSLSLFL